MSDILARRATHFVLWCPAAVTSPPQLILGQIINGNPPKFRRRNPLALRPVADRPDLWELPASECGLKNGQTYHYWFEVDDTYTSESQPTPTGRVQVVDPLAYGVDYRLYAPANPGPEHPAAVIGWVGGKLVAADPNGELATPQVAPFEKLAPNNQLVIYEVPTAWVRSSGNNEFERAVGTFRDLRAMVEANVPGTNFPPVRVSSEKSPPAPYLVELGVNALELLPPADSIYSREWGYGTSHYLAPDYELGYPEGHLSPTSNHDLTELVNSCHRLGIRIFLDVVLGFMKEEPYRRIAFDSFYLEDPHRHPDDEDAYTSRWHDGRRELRNPYGGACPRYVATRSTYDPISGEVKQISPARQHMLTFLTRWMRDFQIDGIRMDSVENVANWDFIQAFKDQARAQFRSRYPAAGDAADAKFLVVGEELSMPLDLLRQGRLDGLWNERFQGYARAAILGENVDFTARRAIDCRLDGLEDGAQAINYLTSHDVQGERKERLYDLMLVAITRANSRHLYDEESIRRRIGEADASLSREQVAYRAHQEVETILHRERLRRIKLGFVCLLTAVGVPMILAGEEFGDQHDLFGAGGYITHEGGKQVDPVNYSRIGDVHRLELFRYVSRLVRLRTSHPALSVNDVEFIHTDFNDGKRVMVWKRGTTDPVVVVANFSGYTTPGAPGSHAEYRVPNWPSTPAGFQWYEVTQQRAVPQEWHDREAIFAWEAKVYRLVPVGAS